jgi:sensor c-di-GMP phosphodiesterase-like protein
MPGHALLIGHAAVIADDLVTELQAAALTANGVMWARVWLFSKALPIDSALALAQRGTLGS